MHYTTQGNISTVGHNHNDFNQLNQLTRVTTPKKQIVYTYYANGLQASESNATITFYRYFMQHKQLINTTTNQAPQIAYYLFGQNPVAIHHDNNSEILFTNRQNSIIGEVLPNKVAIQQYTPYGKPYFSLKQDPFQYDTYFFDHFTGYDDLSARDYVPLLRSFLSRDTVDISNRYFYSLGNPFNGYDPYGHKWDVKRTLFLITGIALNLVSGIGTWALSGDIAKSAQSTGDIAISDEAMQKNESNWCATKKFGIKITRRYAKGLMKFSPSAIANPMLQYALAPPHHGKHDPSMGQLFVSSIIGGLIGNLFYTAFSDFNGLDTPRSIAKGFLRGAIAEGTRAFSTTFTLHAMMHSAIPLSTLPSIEFDTVLGGILGMTSGWNQYQINQQSDQTRLRQWQTFNVLRSFTLNIGMFYPETQIKRHLQQLV